MTRRLVWSAAGWAALGLAAVGLALPLLPTTPFVILSAFAFSRGSPAMRRRLEESRHFGAAIRDWEERGAIRPRHKAMSVGLMAASLLGAVLLGFGPWLLAAQVGAMALASAYVLSRPSS